MIFSVKYIIRNSLFSFWIIDRKVADRLAALTLVRFETSASMKKEMVQYPTRVQIPVYQPELVAVTSRIDSICERFQASQRELIDRVERLRDRVTPLEVQVHELMAQVHAERIRSTTPQVNLVMPGGPQGPGQTADIDGLQARLRRQELEMEQLRGLLQGANDRWVTMRATLDSIQDDVRTQRRQILEFSAQVEGVASRIADQRLARIAYDIPQMTISQLMSQFVPQITAFRIPEFQPLPRIQPILTRAIEGFRVQPLIAEEPRLQLTFDPPPPQPPNSDDDDDFLH